MKNWPHSTFFFIIIIGLAALGLGVWNIGRAYLGFLAGADQVARSTQSKQAGETVLVLPGLDFWTCQVGIFQHEENARQEKEWLTKAGFSAAIVQSNPSTLGVGLGGSMEELNGLRRELEQSGWRTVPKHIVIPEHSYRVYGKDAVQTAGILTRVNGFLRERRPPNALSQALSAWDDRTVTKNNGDLAKLYEVMIRSEGKDDPEERVKLTLPVLGEYLNVIQNMSKGKNG